MLTLLALLLSCAGKDGADSDTQTLVDSPRGDCNPVDDGGCMLPFPSSFFLDEDAAMPSGYRVAFGEGSLPADRFGTPIRPDAWNVRDGFSTMAPLYAHLPGADPASPGSLSFDNLGDYENADVTTVIVDVETGALVPHYIEREAFPSDSTRAALVLHPVVPMEHARRYVVGIRGLTGGTAPAGFATLRDGGSTSDPDLERQRDSYDSVIFPALEAAGFARSELQLAWDFVTVSAEGSLAVTIAVRDDALAQVPATGPAYTITSNVETGCPDGEVRGRTISGEMTVPFYLEADEPGVFLNRPDGTMDGPVVQNGEANVPFTIVVPCSVLADGTPSRLLQAGHGLFGSHTDITGQTFSDVAHRSHAILFATSWRGMSENDYNAVTLMMAGDPSDFGIIPDGLVQGHVEALLMARLMQGDLAGDDALSLDGTSLVDTSGVDFYGVSLGSVLGGAQVAMSPTIDRAVMQISGMPFSLLLTRSASFTAFLALLGAKFDDPLDISMIVPLAQMLWDPTESGGWAHYLQDGTDVGGISGRRFLFQTGVADDTVTSIAGQTYARSVGAGLLDMAPREVWGLETVSDPMTGSGLLEWDYGYTENPVPLPVGLGDADPHNLLPAEESAKDQIAQFFLTGSLGSVCEGICDPE